MRWGRPLRSRRALAGALLAAAGCVAAGGTARARAPGSVRDEGDRTVRVAIASRGLDGRLSSGGAWRLYDGSRGVLARASGGDAWTIENDRRGRVRAVSPRGAATAWVDGPVVARPVDRGSLLAWNAKRYRGELSVRGTDSGLMVVNTLPVEEYLRGVVPLEIGDRTPAEHAAVEAQAVAARSYTYVRLNTGGSRPFDLVNTVSDQVYGGADAERPVADAAVRATERMVLRYGGRIVNAPYSSTCGGSTAEVPEVWYRQQSSPYLRSVSDRIPGTDGYYCDPSPRFAWRQSWDGASLSGIVSRHVAAYAATPAGGPGALRSVSVDGLTPSGRVSSLTVRADGGSFVLRGNDIRFVFRTPGGEILNSTYFSVESMVIARDGHLSQLTLRGRGYGHGIGMCQWGAIGRARAGQDYRAILRTYYPGTDIGQAY